jgi:hypothetical protein
MLPRVIRIYKDEGSEEEEDAELDAVKLFTISEAKDLPWPASLAVALFQEVNRRNHWWNYR